MTDSVNGTLSTSEKEKELKLNQLKELCSENAEYFSKDSSENGQRLYISFLAIIDILNQIWPKILKLEKEVSYFDFDENTPGNGYRSFLLNIDLAIQLAIDVNERVLQKRDSILFRKNSLTKDTESCSHLIVSLNGCLDALEITLKWSDKEQGNLFVKDECPLQELFGKCGQVNQHCFYGRHLGYQFCESVKNVLQFVTISMTLFSEVYYNDGSSLVSKAKSSFMSTTKFLTDPEERAKRIVNISQNAEVDFCKAFWFLAETELLNQLPSIVSSSVAISKIIHLPPEPLTITTMDGREIDIPVPSSFLGRKHIELHLISHKLRAGMLGTKNSSRLEPPSKGLMIHCHGGGFVAQSSKSHVGYLREWAKHLDIPILCINYSLAPEAPYPRAIEEILYAYCWARKNHNLLGSTGENIVGAGDSAGANLISSTTLKCIYLNIPTVKGLFIAYAPIMVHYIPTPARLLCMMDPLIPFGFLMRCLKAYACPDEKLIQQCNENGQNSDTESFEEITESDLLELQAHKSPVSDTSDTLTYGSLTSNDEGGTTKPSNNSDKEASDFLEKYILDSDTDTDGTRISILRNESESSASTITENSIQNKVTSFVYSMREQFTKYMQERTAPEKLLDLDIDPETALSSKFSFDVSKDPLLSPLFATDEDLKKFPPTTILSVNMDPCLDDCIMFAKRLRGAGNNVKLQILSGLPHGFLNFSLFSREAYEGSRVCIERIQELLDLE
ncbi:unnamed protein product [Phaedon cochleariae]|uniref:Hormone-sensitive lipase n=1 Tax=Phaedon cochleariae TaxID=80249 RepID=A0A9N9SHW2_PHACE|nr:unnamed protein product [Phaedon cochleariae]